MLDRFEQLPKEGALSIFYTAGYPRLKDTMTILGILERAGVNMVEVGFPFSDPVADGPTIQASNMVALEGGMSSTELFAQLRGMRKEISIPVLLMGYLNPVEQFGVEQFLSQASDCGVDGIIVPDMPFEEYRVRYKTLYGRYGVKPVFLVTSRTEKQRIREFDSEDPAFLYVVSSEAVTGSKAVISEEQRAFYERLREMNLSSRLIVGFGVSSRADFEAVTSHTHGAIIGSAFIRSLANISHGSDGEFSDPAELERRISEFVRQYR